MITRHWTTDKQLKLSNSRGKKSQIQKYNFHVFLATKQQQIQNQQFNPFTNTKKRSEKRFPILFLPIPRSGWMIAIFSLELPFFSIGQCLTQTTVFFPINQVFLDWKHQNQNKQNQPIAASYEARIRQRGAVPECPTLVLDTPRVVSFTKEKVKGLGYGQTTVIGKIYIKSHKIW